MSARRYSAQVDTWPYRAADYLAHVGALGLAVSLVSLVLIF